MILIEQDGRRQLVASLDGYDGATVIADNVSVPQWANVDNIKDDGTADIIAAETYALGKIEADAETASFGEFPKLRRQIAVVLLWHEIQRLKLSNATGNIPADLTERRKQFPTLMALVALSGNTLTQVATAAENRLWDRVRRMALWEAKLMLADDAVRASATAAGKVAAANVTWSE
jgi:hypothetical protein